MNWQELQKESASLFRSLGCEAKIEEKIEGARGVHKIDLLVKYRAIGMESVWIVECKNWNSNVSKEKVLALQSIVQDVGADKGILISKQGFQSGAIRCAENSNIILTDFQELQTIIQEELASIGWRQFSDRVKKLKMCIFDQKNGKLNFGLLGFASLLESRLEEVFLHGGKMVLLKDIEEMDRNRGKESFVGHSDKNEFLKHVGRLLDEIEARINCDA